MTVNESGLRLYAGVSAPRLAGEVSDVKFAPPPGVADRAGTFSKWSENTARGDLLLSHLRRFPLRLKPPP
ncbi:hypothetical protein SRHO_G00169620 [Serrasalmus rhombeus]